MQYSYNTPDSARAYRQRQIELWLDDSTNSDYIEKKIANKERDYITRSAKP